MLLTKPIVSYIQHKKHDARRDKKGGDFELKEKVGYHPFAEEKVTITTSAYNSCRVRDLTRKKNTTLQFKRVTSN